MRRQVLTGVVGSLLLVAAGVIFWMSLDSDTDLERFRGQPRDVVIEKLGPPMSIQKFRMFEARTEFRRGLQAIYPLSKPGNDRVVIEEITWRDGDFRNTLWLHNDQGKWVVIDAVRWQPNPEAPAQAMNTR